MIYVFVAIVCIIMILEFLISWIKAILDDFPDDTYEYCYNCKYGFCIEDPMTQKCKKYMEEKENEK